MKVTIEKGLQKSATAKLFDGLITKALEEFEADGIGKISMYFDVYKDGKKVDSKSYSIDSIWDKPDKVVRPYDNTNKEGEV